MDFYQRSRACYKHLKLEQSPGYADLLVNMGRLEVTLDQNHEALQVFREAQNVYEAIGVTASPGYANLLLNIGHLQAQKLDDLDSAVAAFREARDIYMEVKASGIAVAQVNFNLGRALQEKGLRGEATKAYERALIYQLCVSCVNPDWLILPERPWGKMSRSGWTQLAKDVLLRAPGSKMQASFDPRHFFIQTRGRHPPSTPRNKRLLTDASSNIFIFITGHSGEEFIKFQDWEELTSNDIADAFKQMQQQRRYKQIFWVSDTCQAATLQNQFYSPGILAIGSSGKKLGVAVIDRFTFHALDKLERLAPSSPETVKSFTTWTAGGRTFRLQQLFNPQLLKAHPELRSDLFERNPGQTLLTEFLASTGRPRFQGGLLPVAAARKDIALADLMASRNTTCAACASSQPELQPSHSFEVSFSGQQLWQQLKAKMQLAVDATFDQKEALVFPVLEPRSQLCEPARSIEDHFYFGCWALALFASPLLWSSDHCRVFYSILFICASCFVTPARMLMWCAIIGIIAVAGDTHSQDLASANSILAAAAQGGFGVEAERGQAVAADDVSVSNTAQLPMTDLEAESYRVCRCLCVAMPD
eukprot:g28841.t1